MKVFIPKHLREIPIINRLYEMIKAYSEDEVWNSETPDPFDDYRFSLKIDPVKKFLELCIPYRVSLYIDGVPAILDSDKKEAIIDSVGVPWEDAFYDLVESERRERITYLSRMFYSVKGTYRVFDFILGFEIFRTTKCDINYTTRSIQIYISEISIDRDLFCSALEGFLSALLYFESLQIIIGSTRTRLTQELGTSINYGEMFYTYNKLEYNQ